MTPHTKAKFDICKYLIAHGWFVKGIGASAYSSGWPDLYAYHPVHRHRWIEVKVGRDMLQSSQVKCFEELTLAGDKVFVMTSSKDYNVLFRDKGNWYKYIRR